MVKTHTNIIPLDTVHWFKQDMVQRISNNEHEIRTVVPGVDLESIYQISNDCRTMEHRVVLDMDDPAYKKIAEYVYQIVPSTQWFYAAYQRQFLPQALHADYVNPDTDLTYAYSMIIPLDENINGIFKTIVWKQTLIVDEDIRNLISEFSSSPEQHPKVYKNSEQYDLQHVTWYADSIIDSLELDGVYNYQLGSIGQFNRNQMHCSSNWTIHRVCDYKDFIVVHVN